MHKAGWNVATSRRWVNKNKSQQAATSQRSDVSTSRRLNVMTLQHHDVSAIFCLSIIKNKGGPKFEGIEDRTKQSTKNQNNSDLDLEEGTHFCIFFFSDKSTDVL